MRFAWTAVVTGLAAAAGACGPGSASVDEGHGSLSLVDVEWQVVSVSEDGDEWVLPESVRGLVRFDGSGHFSADACNQLYGDATVEGDKIRFGDERQTTLAGCRGERRRAEVAVGRLLSGVLSWEVTPAGELLLDNDVLSGRLTRAEPPFPTPGLTVIAAETGNGPQWQVGYERATDGLFLTWEGRAEAGQPWSTSGFEVSYATIGAQMAAAGSSLLVFGHAPGEAAAVRFVSDAGALDLEVVPVDGRWQLFADEVPSTTGHVIAYDSAGQELARTRPLGP